MCGIAGVFSFKGNVDPSLLEKMNAEIIHRGPDSDGFFSAGHVGLCMRRLKVIDLDTGNQPIHDGSEKSWIIFNGEIYNYRELRADLEKKGHRFYTKSDTEAILHAYMEYGKSCVERLIGMFAFAIFDSAKDAVFIARDRLGIKPLFYHESGEGVAFASEIKPLLQAPWISAQINPQAVSHFLSLNYLPHPWTPFSGVRQLAPGHWMEISKRGVIIQEYWDVPHGETLDVGEEEACKKILGLMHRSMERRLIADVPIGTFLSGGLDSSALVWLMKEHKHDTIKTFSVGFDHPDYDETPHARAVAKHFGTDHHEIKCAPQDVFKTLARVTWHADNLLGDQAALPLYMVSKLARQHVTVCLSGDGGDEIFVGYPTYHANQYHRYYSRIPSFLRKGMIEPAVRALPASVNKLSFEYKAKKFVQAGDFDSERAHYWWRTIFTEQEKQGVLTLAAQTAIGDLDSYPLYGQYLEKARAAGHVNRCLYADMKVWLAGNNLYKVDTMSMAHGLEARVPFLDHELVEYMARLPAELKFKGSVLKYLFKKILRGKLPESIRSRRKAGFHSPVAYWFRHALNGHLRELLQEKHDAFDFYFKKDALLKMVEEHRRGGGNHTYRLWSLLTFKFWLKAFGGNE